MSQYHINPATKRPNICKAPEGECSVAEVHYGSQEEARLAAKDSTHSAPSETAAPAVVASAPVEAAQAAVEDVTGIVEVTVIEGTPVESATVIVAEDTPLEPAAVEVSSEVEETKSLDLLGSAIGGVRDRVAEAFTGPEAKRTVELLKEGAVQNVKNLESLGKRGVTTVRGLFSKRS